MKMENGRVTYMREAAANEHAESKMPSMYYNLGAAVAAEMMHGFFVYCWNNLSNRSY